MRLLPLLLSICFALPALALTVDKPLPDAVQEMRARELFTQVRCVVCQSEAIADSPAEVARDMRVEIRAQVADGKTDKQILSYLVDRYGDGILMRPPLTASTWLLWFGPLLILLFGIFAVRRFFKSARQQA